MVSDFSTLDLLSGANFTELSLTQVLSSVFAPTGMPQRGRRVDLRPRVKGLVTSLWCYWEVPQPLGGVAWWKEMMSLWGMCP